MLSEKSATTLFLRRVFLEPVPTTQFPTSAVRRIAGLQIVKVQTSQNGFGAAPSSIRKTYE